MHAHSILRIADIHVWLSLGCSAAEQQNPHAVRITVELAFEQAPRGATTDQLTETLCYRTIVERIQTTLQQHAFHLIEHVAWRVYETVCKTISPLPEGTAITEIRATAHKIAPPVPGLHGGVSFTYSGPLT
ncbi:MAG: hypothetical protein A3J38_03880 [Gammaproteobacteria bacterium RIFCSPHIGHO2_12_FULL_45_9]|nr:MAG: hypothetical protein A3J38_03880 [Gammaproteobacteria bacterium RIFCSPHIGHO2_12_FULL_45_9]